MDLALDADTSAAYDQWFESGWGAYAFAIECGLVRDAVGDIVGASIVDVGCGTGRFAEYLEHAGGQVVGLDIAPAMVRRAVPRTRGPLCVADAHALPFPNRAFDVGVVIAVLEFVERPDRVMSELARVTRPGGRIVVGALNPSSPWGLAHRRQLLDPPWDEARFLSRPTLRALGRPHGRVRMTGGLFAPGVLPGLSQVGRGLEALGRPLPRFGAFQVMVVER